MAVEGVAAAAVAAASQLDLPVQSGAGGTHKEQQWHWHRGVAEGAPAAPAAQAWLGELPAQVCRCKLLSALNVLWLCMHSLLQDRCCRGQCIQQLGRPVGASAPGTAGRQQPQFPRQQGEQGLLPKPQQQPLRKPQPTRVTLQLLVAVAVLEEEGAVAESLLQMTV